MSPFKPPLINKLTKRGIMKKLFPIIFITILIFLFNIKNTFAYTESFNLLIETMDVSKQNVSGLFINEEIYNEYSLFVYGSPLNSFSGQRWKDVSDGHWTKNGGVWNGTGVRGEYWILGENYYGKEVHNHKFPVDIEPPTQPTSWRYAVIPDALESWQETDKYMDDIQKEYMLTQKLMRNDTTYDLTVMDIGLNKVRLENYATWKTKGTVYTQRYDMNNKKWAANFMVPAMAGDADLEGYAQFPNGTTYNLSEDAESVNIPIIYGSEVINLTEYAKSEHVKEIKSQLYINGIFIDEISKSQTLEVSKATNFLVNKSEYNANNITLNVQVKSTLFTKFITDGALVDVKNYTIYINFGDEEENNNPGIYNNVNDLNYSTDPELPPPRITSVTITRIVDGEEKSLLKSKKTGKEFICAGQTISIKANVINNPDTVTVEFEGDTSITTFDELTKKFEWTEPRNRSQKTFFSTLSGFEKMYRGYLNLDNIRNNKFEYTYIIPYGTKQTLHSWNTLRNISKDAFSIDENKLFTRITNPYEVVVKAEGPTGADTKRIELDVFERWDTIYNRDIKKYVY